MRTAFPSRFPLARLLIPLAAISLVISGCPADAPRDAALQPGNTPSVFESPKGVYRLVGKQLVGPITFPAGRHTLTIRWQAQGGQAYHVYLQSVTSHQQGLTDRTEYREILGVKPSAATVGTSTGTYTFTTSPEGEQLLSGPYYMIFDEADPAMRWLFCIDQECKLEGL